MLPTNLLCFFPTSIAIVDDSKSFLAMANMKLPQQQLCQFYSNPTEALQQINASEKSSEQLNRVLKNLLADKTIELETDFDHDTNILINVDLSQLHKEIFNAQRFNRISVVLVDYSMEPINGIEFCRNLQDKAIKKIMITAKAGYQLAIQAFNEGLIDKFILKDTPNLFGEINSSITTAQSDYFKSIYGADGVLGFIFRNELSICNNLQYQQLLSSINNTIAPVEYYRLDNSGSILFLNKQAHATWLAVKTVEELDKLHSIAADNHAPKNILTLLQKKQAMPIFLSQEDYITSAADWIMYPIQSLSPEKTHFYSLISRQNIDSLQLDDVVSFESRKLNNLFCTP